MQVGSAMKIVHSEESLAAMDDEDKLGYVWIHSADVLSGDEASKVVGATYCHGCSRQALIGVSQAGGGGIGARDMVELSSWRGWGCPQPGMRTV